MADNMDLLYTIELSDGIELAGLQLNGNNYISEEPVDESSFDLNTSPVTIHGFDGEGNEVLTEEHEHMELVQLLEPEEETYHSHGYWFVLRDVPAEELAATELQANIEYLAMMTDVEL